METPAELGRPPIELAMLGRDGWHVRRMLGGLPDRGDGGVLAPALAPHAAFYVVEAYDCLRQLSETAPQFAVFREHDSAIRALREHIKLSAGRRGLPGLIDLLALCEKSSVEWFNRAHGGWLGPLKRLLQCDLGLYFHGGHLVSTTHVALANLSLGSPDSVGQRRDSLEAISMAARSFSEKLGQFVGVVTSAFPQYQADMAPLVGQPAQFSIQRPDCKAAVFYADLGKRLGLTAPRPAAFTFLASSVNFVHHLLRRIVPEQSDFLFRVKFLTAHYALERLGWFNAAVRGDRNTFVGRLAADVQGTPEGRALRKLGDTLRNDIAHYSIRTMLVPATTSPASPSLRELLEGHSPTTNEIDALVDTQLEMLSRRCRDVLSS